MARVFYSVLFVVVCAISSIYSDQNETTTLPFTGKITGNRVRIRCSPDLDSLVIQELKKNDFVRVVEDAQDFWAIDPPLGTKVYVFRSYILDNLVEANRVNIRLKPDIDSPIIGQLNHGERIDGTVCSADHKWIEINPPKSIHFYIAKDYIISVGDGNYLSYIQKRKEEVEKLLNSAFYLTQNECKKSFHEMKPQEAMRQFETIIKGYPDFSEYVQQAKEGLSLLQDNYLQKKIAYLETKANISETEKEKMVTDLSKFSSSSKLPTIQSLSEKMRFWNSVEESLFQTWATLHPKKSIDDFYNEQEINGIQIIGTIQPLDSSIHDKPGDYLIHDNQGPVAYLYSTRIDLDKHAGKKVIIHASSRDNHNFAFPAYFVTSVIE